MLVSMWGNWNKFLVEVYIDTVSLDICFPVPSNAKKISSPLDIHPREVSAHCSQKREGGHRRLPTITLSLVSEDGQVFSKQTSMKSWRYKPTWCVGEQYHFQIGAKHKDYSFGLVSFWNCTVLQSLLLGRFRQGTRSDLSFSTSRRLVCAVKLRRLCDC